MSGATPCSTRADTGPVLDAYDEAIDNALAEHERGHFAEARAWFLRAHELAPSARTLRGLGKTEFELRNYGQAAAYLEAALSATSRPLDAALRADTELVLTRARLYVGELHVNVEPSTATVSVDGVVVARGPSAELSLVVGDHLLEFRAQGHLSERRLVSVQGGTQSALNVVLSSPSGLSADASFLTPSHESESPEPTYKKWWVWTAVGAVTTAAVVGAAVAVRRHGRDGSRPGNSSGVVLVNP